MDNFWYKDSQLPPLPPPTVRDLLDPRLRCENGRTAKDLSISIIRKLTSRQRHFGDEIRAADDSHASTRLSSTCSTSSTTPSTHHDRPTSRRRRCGCTDCDELLLHRLHFPEASTPSRLSSSSLQLLPRAQRGLITTSTTPSRRHLDDKLQLSSEAAADISGKKQNRELRFGQ